MDINELLHIAMSKGASDLHLVVPNSPFLRIAGRLTAFGPKITPEMTASWFQSISTRNQQQIFEQEQELDFSMEIPDTARFRVNVSRQRDSISLVFRLIPLKIPTFEELGLPEICKALALLPRGLVLITGPTGSGKSSTLAGMLNYLNENDEKKVVTIEDPIEYVFPPGKCLISQRELGNDTKAFNIAVEHALRQDPNVIMIGEMRDLGTISGALTAAETGHLVLSTLHTRGAAESVSRVIDVFPVLQQPLIRMQLANVLQAVISQVLLRRADGEGRVAAFEVMIGNTAIRNLIHENNLRQIPIFIESGREEGMKLLKLDLERLISEGVITSDEALTVAEGIKEAESRVRKTMISEQSMRRRMSKVGGEITLQKIKDNGALESPPVPVVVELTAEELLSAYEAEGEAADALFVNKVLKVTGIVDRIQVNDSLGIDQVFLTANKTRLLQRVRCVFDRKHKTELNSLTKGQMATVQGKYDGSIIDIRLRDCVMVH